MRSIQIVLIVLIIKNISVIKAVAKLFKNKVILYLFFGGITTLFNVVLLTVLIEVFNITTPLGRNIANLFALEVSVIFSFWVYKMWVWTEIDWNWRTIMLKQIPLFHASMGVVIALRIFLLFPVLDWLGVQYIINTLIGIALGAVVTYFWSDKVVFKK